MATVVDALIVTLGLDPSDFARGQKAAGEALDRTKKDSTRVAKEVEEAGKRASQFFVDLRKTAIEFFAVFTAGKGLKDFIADTIEGENAVGRLSKQLGTSVETMSAWRGVAERMGGSTQGITQVMQNITQQLEHFRATGEPGALQTWFANWFHPVDQATGKFKTFDQILRELSQHLQGMDPRVAANALRESIGADPATIDLILRGPRELQRLLAEQRKIGVQTPADMAAASRLTNSWEGLKQASERLGQILLTQLEPYIRKVLDTLKDVAEWVQEHPAVLDAIFAGAAALIGGLTISLGTTLLGALGVAGAGIAAFSSGPILVLATAIGAIAIAIDLVTNKGQGLMDLLNTKIDSPTKGTPGPIGRWLDEHIPVLGPSAPSIDTMIGDLFSQSRRTRGSLGEQRGPYVRGAMTPAETEAYIRKSAAARGIDPDIAVSVAKSEGGLGFKAGDPALIGMSSFGPFQLHYGFPGGRGNNAPGLGNTFTEKTGLDARDPATVRKQIDFALDQAKLHGWGAWHGWQGTPWAGISAPGAGPVAGAVTNNTTHDIDVNGPITINTRSDDARGIAGDFRNAIRRSWVPGAAGLQ